MTTTKAEDIIAEMERIRAPLTERLQDAMDADIHADSQLSAAQRSAAQRSAAQREWVEAGYALARKAKQVLKRELRRAKVDRAWVGHAHIGPDGQTVLWGERKNRRIIPYLKATICSKGFSIESTWSGYDPKTPTAAMAESMMAWCRRMALTAKCWEDANAEGRRA